MDADRVLRPALWTTAAFNLGVALLIMFAESRPAQLAGLPEAGPALYRWLLAYLIGLFGVMYAWLAARPSIDRPMLVLATVGKAGAASVAVVCWLAGQATGRITLLASGDIVFAAIFVWWLSANSPQND